jgi:hypothetical protein
LNKKNYATICGGDKKTMEIKLTRKKAKFLSRLKYALKQIPSTSTVESTKMKNVILRDMAQLEKNASSGNVSFSGDLN